MINRMSRQLRCQRNCQGRGAVPKFLGSGLLRFAGRFSPLSLLLGLGVPSLLLGAPLDAQKVSVSQTDQSVSVSPGDALYGMAVADLDGDGEKDVAVHNGLKREVVVLQGNNGTFREIMRLPVGYWGSAIAAGDVDGDGRADLVVSRNNCKTDDMLLYRNTGHSGRMAFDAGKVVFVGRPGCDRPDWTFSATTVSLTDVDGDGRADLVAGGMWVQEEGPWVGRDVAVLRADGQGGFLQPEFYAARPERLRGYGNNATGEVKVADVDGDGNLDLLVTTGSTVSLLRGLGEGEFDFAQVLVADEKVEYTDVVVLSTGEIAMVGNESLQGVRPVVKVLRVEGKSVSVQGTIYPAGRNGATVGSLAAGDVNGDGLADLVVSYAGRGGAVLYGSERGYGCASGACAYGAEYGTTDVSRENLWVGDLDGDKRMDLLVSGVDGVLRRGQPAL